MLTISVILPTHAPCQRADALERAVASILGQSRPPGQLIVVHDGPGRVPPDLAGRAADAGIDYRYVRSDRPSLPRSRNTGVDAADGDIVVFGEDDLTFPPDYMQRVASLYAADAEQRVAGIGAAVCRPGSLPLRRRAWDLLARWLGEGCWGPRRQAARYATLPPALAGRLVPAARLSGGGLTLRRTVAAAERFDETMSGYAFGEDMEFCYRIAPRRTLYRAPELTALHLPAAAGRPDGTARGRMYAAGTLRIVRNVAAGGAGTWLLAAYQLGGMALLYAAWSAVSLRADKARFARGLVWETARTGAGAVRRLLCGC